MSKKTLWFKLKDYLTVFLKDSKAVIPSRGTAIRSTALIVYQNEWHRCLSQSLMWHYTAMMEQSTISSSYLIHSFAKLPQQDTTDHEASKLAPLIACAQLPILLSPCGPEVQVTFRWPTPVYAFEKWTCTCPTWCSAILISAHPMALCKNAWLAPLDALNISFLSGFSRGGTKAYLQTVFCGNHKAFENVCFLIHYQSGQRSWPGS